MKNKRLKIVFDYDVFVHNVFHQICRDYHIFVQNLCCFDILLSFFAFFLFDFQESINNSLDKKFNKFDFVNQIIVVIIIIMILFFLLFVKICINFRNVFELHIFFRNQNDLSNSKIDDIVVQLNLNVIDNNEKHVVEFVDV